MVAAMTCSDYPSGADIRAVLLWRAQLFTELTGMKPSTISLHALNDPAMLSRLSKGSNFTVNTYQRLMDWFDNHWPASTAITVPSSLQMTKNVKPDFCHLSNLTRGSE